MSKQQLYYEMNRIKVLTYKKEFYKKKTELLQILKSFEIIGFKKKSTSKKLIKTAFYSKCLKIYIDDNEIEINELRYYQITKLHKCFGLISKELSEIHCEYLTDKEALEYLDNFKDKICSLEIYLFNLPKKN